MKSIVVTFFTAFLFGFTALSQEIDIQKIDSFVSHIEDNNRGIGSVSIFKDGKEIYNRSFGQDKLENVDYNAETKYQIGSITKIFTANLLFELIENNKLHLDDKLSMFYPEIPNSDIITIKNLLEHSSGLGNFAVKNDSVNWLTEKVDEIDIIEEIRRQGVSFQPGEKVKYSNSGYFFLARIAEKLFKQDYASIVEERIAKPLNLLSFISSTLKFTFAFNAPKTFNIVSIYTT